MASTRHPRGLLEDIEKVALHLPSAIRILYGREGHLHCGKAIDRRGGKCPLPNTFRRLSLKMANSLFRTTRESSVASSKIISVRGHFSGTTQIARQNLFSRAKVGRPRMQAAYMAAKLTRDHFLNPFSYTTRRFTVYVVIFA